MTRRADKAIKVLLEALRTNILRKGACTSCAVGHLVGSKLGVKYLLMDDFSVESTLKNGSNYNPAWYDVISYLNSYDVETGKSFDAQMFKAGLEEISDTGYSLGEIMEVERLFERSTTCYIQHYSTLEGISLEAFKEDMTKGVMKVINYLLELDNCKETIENIVKDFNKIER